MKKLVEKPVPAPVNPLPVNGVDLPEEVVDDEGDEWQVRIDHNIKIRPNKRPAFIVKLIFQLIGNRNKGTVTRSTDFGRTPLSDIFRGELRSRLQREGDHSTDVLQPFFTLQLNIEVIENKENFLCLKFC